jgi:hypothetical protein
MLGSIQQHIRAWLALWECGWSVQKIPDAWGWPVHEVQAALNQSSTVALPPVRPWLILPTTKEQAKEQRDALRLLYRQGQTVQQLTERYRHYSLALMEHIVRQPLETAEGKVWAQKHLHGKPPRPQLTPQTGQRACACGCRRPVAGRRKWAREGCRKRGSLTMAISAMS